MEVTIGDIVLVLYELRKKQSKYLDVVQNIVGDCISVQFLKHSEKKTFSVRDGDFDDCLCHHIKAVIKEGQFTMNTRRQYLIEEMYHQGTYQSSCFICYFYVVSYISTN